MKKILFVLLFLAASATLRAASIDTLKVFSVKMQREIPTVVVTPDHAEGDRFPVVYLLHGYGGDELAWQRITDLRPLAEQFGVIFVCPDGENSWYWDSPLDPTSQFETFVSRELPAWVDSRYPTLPARESRAIAGLSMGGHGAMWIALRHKDLFGAVASVSGGVDIRPFPDSWEMKKQLGEESGNQERWNRYTVINQVDSLKDGELAIFVDCGYQDFFYDVNVALHEKLLKQGVGHDFLTRPGAHTGEYWAASLPHQLLFFRAYFDGAPSK